MKRGLTVNASLFRRFMDTHVYTTGFVKIWKTHHEISVDIQIFFFTVHPRRLRIDVHDNDNA